MSKFEHLELPDPISVKIGGKDTGKKLNKKQMSKLLKGIPKRKIPLPKPKPMELEVHLPTMMPYADKRFTRAKFNRLMNRLKKMSDAEFTFTFATVADCLRFEP